jgi:predicted RNA-binding Zn ribbon-like protein
MLGTPTAATMRLDGGHPALELVNTIYAVLGGPVDFDVLTTPDDLVTLARRVGVAGEGAVPSDGALRAARALRDALDPLLRAHLVARDAGAARRDAAVRGERAAAPGGGAEGGERAAAPGDGPAARGARAAAPGEAAAVPLPARVATASGESDVAPALAAFEAAVRAAQDAARLSPGYAWTWDGADPLAPVHRLAYAAAQLLTGPDLALLHCCDACCWLYLNRSGKRRKWCSMADCGTEAKKRRYVERRRQRRRGAAK